MNTFREKKYLNGGKTRQTGAVLIVSLIMLAILTLLAVTGMQTTALEEKMAGNSQEVNRALQTAETGLVQAYSDTNNTYDLAVVDGEYIGPTADLSDTNHQTQYESTYIQTVSTAPASPDPNRLYRADDFVAYHFNFKSNGTTEGGIAVTLNGGGYQITKKQ